MVLISEFENFFVRPSQKCSLIDGPLTSRGSTQTDISYGVSNDIDVYAR
jgi:hypothetical protein